MIDTAVAYKGNLSPHDQEQRREALNDIRDMVSLKGFWGRKTRLISPNTIPHQLSHGAIPLGYAGARGDTEVMDILYEAGADVNLRNTHYNDMTGTRTPSRSVLMHTLEGDNGQAISWLFDKRELRLTDEGYGHELLHVPSGQNTRMAIEGLRAKGLDIGRKGPAAIRDYLTENVIYNVDLYRVQCLLEAGVSPGTQDEQGDNILHFVVRYLTRPLRSPLDVMTPEKAKKQIILLLTHDPYEQPLRSTRNRNGKTPQDLLLEAKDDDQTFDNPIIDVILELLSPDRP